MWELYKLLGSSMNQQYIIDEIIKILETVHPQNIKRSMELLYGKMPTIPLELGTKLVLGLNHNKFFEFQVLMEQIR
jgi:hypothetical protein